MNNFSVGYAEDLKNGCNSHGEAIILNPSRRDTTIIHYSFKFQIAQQRDKLKFADTKKDEALWGLRPFMSGFQFLLIVNCQFSIVN